MRRSPTPESQVLHAILDYLAAVRILAFRQNVGIATFGVEGATRHVPYGVLGMADIVAFPKNRPVLWIEVKTAKGIQSDLQKSFQRQVEEYGHEYLIVRSIDDLEAWLNR
jgi:hypothetical protein